MDVPKSFIYELKTKYECEIKGTSVIKYHLEYDFF